MSPTDVRYVPGLHSGRGASRRCPRTGAPARAVLPVVLNTCTLGLGPPPPPLESSCPCLASFWHLFSRPGISPRSAGVLPRAPAPLPLRRLSPFPRPRESIADAPPRHRSIRSLRACPTSPPRPACSKRRRESPKKSAKNSLSPARPPYGGRAGEREFPPSPPGAELTQPVETRPLAAALIHSLGHEARCPRGGLR